MQFPKRPEGTSGVQKTIDLDRNRERHKEAVRAIHLSYHQVSFEEIQQIEFYI